MPELPPEQREPKHLEGMFRINLIEAQAALTRGEIICEFRDEKSRVVGQCALPDIVDGRILLVFELAGQYRGLSRGEVWLPIIHVPNPLDPNRHYFLCAGCSRRAAVLAFKGQWKCPGCHQLRYRRQLISKDVAAAEAYSALLGEIGDGRPVGMHNTNYLGKCQQLARWKEYFAGTSLPEASLAHRRMLFPRWVAPDHLTDRLWLQNYQIQNGELVKMPEGWLD